MSKLTKKKLKEIEQLSIFDEIIIKYANIYDLIGKVHWLDSRPDMWSKEMVREFDMMNELEMRLKNEILKIINQ